MIWFSSKVVYGEAVMCRVNNYSNSTILLGFNFKEPNHKFTWTISLSVSTQGAPRMVEIVTPKSFF